MFFLLLYAFFRWRYKSVQIFVFPRKSFFLTLLFQNFVKTNAHDLVAAVVVTKKIITGFELDSSHGLINWIVALHKFFFNIKKYEQTFVWSRQTLSLNDLDKNLLKYFSKVLFLLIKLQHIEMFSLLSCEVKMPVWWKV